MDHLAKFIQQEMEACEGASPEMITVFGNSLVDWLHPQLEKVTGIYITSRGDEEKHTILVCKPHPEYQPTIIQFWEDDKLSEHKAVYLCPNAVIVLRPTEEGDMRLCCKEPAEVAGR